MVPKLGLHLFKLTSILKNRRRGHCRHQSEALSASLQSFWSDVSAALSRTTSNSTPGPEFRSLAWIGLCLEQLFAINTSFAKLVMDIGCPVSEWGAASVEEYLAHSLNLLNFLNSISSFLSHLGQSCLSLSHALSLIGNPSSSATHRLRPIKLKSENCSHDSCMKMAKKGCKEKFDHCKEALLVMRIAGFFLCGIVLSNPSVHAKQCFELMKSADSFSDFTFTGFDLRILCGEMMAQGGVMREVKEVNAAVTLLVAAIEAGGERNTGEAAEELRQRLEVLQKQVEGIGKEVDRLFAEVLAGRNQLLRSLMQKKKRHQ